jgi:hypothetical protein
MLLVRPNPNQYESWQGYILRLAEANFVKNPKDVLRVSGISEKKLRGQIPEIQFLKIVTGKSEDVLNRIYPEDSGNGTLTLFGHSIAKYYLRMQTPKVCVKCVKELGYIKALWDFTYINACTKHQCKLTSQCPHCKSQLSWYRPGLLICECGEDFGDHRESVASDEELFFTDCFRRIFERDISEMDVIRSPIPLPFYKMQLSTFNSIVTSLGTKSLSNASGGKLRAVKDKRVYWEAIRILNDWDNGFRALMAGSVSANNNQNFFRAKFSNLYVMFFKKEYLAQDIKFLKKEFIKHAMTFVDVPIIDGRTKSKFELEDKDIKFMGMYQAAKFLDTTPPTLRGWIKKGLVETRLVIQPSGKKLVMIDVNSISLKKNNPLGDLDLRSAATYLGLPASLMKPLRKSGHIKNAYRTTYELAWAIPDLNDFLEDLYKQRKSNNLDYFNDPIQLDYTIKRICLGDDETKAEIIRGVMHQVLPMVALSKKLSEMYISKAGMDLFLNNHVRKIRNQISFREVTVLLGLSISCKESFINSGYFETDFRNRNTFFLYTEIEKFHSEYISLLKLSKLNKVAVNLLIAKMNNENLAHVSFESNTGGFQYFLKRTAIS